MHYKSVVSIRAPLPRCCSCIHLESQSHRLLLPDQNGMDGEILPQRRQYIHRRRNLLQMMLVESHGIVSSDE